ncbi:MAG: hypothetical protein GY925_12925 [Actinomycetia bacterium]|nr:hypothetical protein [Actinomycetes bacterium]
MEDGGSDRTDKTGNLAATDRAVVAHGTRRAAIGVAVVALVAVATIGVAVFLGGGEPASSPPSAPVPEILLRAPIHADAAERMRPGALAALQLTTLLDVDMEARAQTAALLWDFYASRIEVCRSATGDDAQLPRIEVPPGDDPTWDLIREPSHEFRPTDEEWNRRHGFASRDFERFWDKNRRLFDFPVTLDHKCAQSAYPYGDLISFAELQNYGAPLDFLALEVIDSLRSQLPGDGQPDSWVPDTHEQIDRCMIDLGIDPKLIESDYWELFAAGPHPDAADFSVAEGACIERILGPLDSELLRRVVEFVDHNEGALFETSDTVEYVKARLADR